MKAVTANFLLGVMLITVAPKVSGATVLYALATKGQLYRSADGANTWQPLAFPGQPNAGSSIAVDPSNPSVIYISCVPFSAKGSSGGVSVPSNNVYRSTDGGATWTGVHAPLPGLRLTVDPTSPNIVYLGTGSGFFRSTDSGSTWASSTLASPVLVISLDPQQHGVIYASTGDFPPTVYKSADFGVT